MYSILSHNIYSIVYVYIVYTYIQKRGKELIYLMVLSIMGISTGGESGGFSIYIIYPMTEQLKKQNKKQRLYK